MHPTKIDIFFSCSFSSTDTTVNNYFMAICKALDLQPTNVETGYALSPPDVAKRKIEACQALIAICTKRDELKDGGFIMPPAVHDEISFAFGKDTPVLMIVEKGVQLLGFKPNFGTYLSFERNQLKTPQFSEKAIRAIHELRLGILGSNQGAEQGMADSYAEYIHHMVELRSEDGGFGWHYATTKKLVYTHASKRGFPSGVWSTVPSDAPPDSAGVKWSYELMNSTRGLTLTATVEKQTPSCIEVLLKPTPAAEEGDFIEYATLSSSRYMNAVWDDEVTEGASVHLEEGDYRCADGLVFIHRTRRAVVEFRFASTYGLKKSDVVPFVGSYTSAVDYEVKSELRRAEIKTEDFGGTLVVRMELESPLPGHMYGVAWNPKPRPRKSVPETPEPAAAAD